MLAWLSHEQTESHAKTTSNPLGRRGQRSVIVGVRRLIVLLESEVRVSNFVIAFLYLTSIVPWLQSVFFSPSKPPILSLTVPQEEGAHTVPEGTGCSFLQLG